MPLASTHIPPTITALQPTAVLLDLDGTITDSAPAITRAIDHTLTAFGYPRQTPEELLRFVGPPIRQGFTELAGVTADELEAVVAAYRQTYTLGMLDAGLYPGIVELIDALAAAGLPLAVATSKVRDLAVDILEHAGLAGHFTVICGASADETRGAKADVVADALAGLRQAGADTAGAVMVGDRHHDVQGATAHGLRVVLAGWGYGQPGEEDGAHAVAHNVRELAVLLGLTLRS